MNDKVVCSNDLDTQNLLFNNSTINIGLISDKNIIINCPKLGSGDVHHNTNSPFCKHYSCVNYNWQNTNHVNWLSIHRSHPIIAYVINPSYRKSHITKSSSFSPSDQIIRLLNYEENVLGKFNGNFNQTIADICFSYNCVSQKETFLAAVDLNSNVNIFVYKEVCKNGKRSFDGKLILDIKSVYDFVHEYAVLNWCPFLGFEDDDDDIDEENDPGMKLAVASENSIEIFSVNKLISYNSEFKRSELDPEEHDYQVLSELIKKPIIKISLSGESSAVCTAYKDKKVKFYQIKSEFIELHNWEPELPSTSTLSFFHFLDDFNWLLEHKKHEFWGFAFLGTEQGEISIWDLRKWKVIQRLKLECNNSKEDVFKYKTDITSRIIIAMNQNDAFVIQLDQESNDYSEILCPKIIKISRFQIYYKVLSFVCKKTSEKKIDIFLISPTSLQRCTIDIELLIEEKINEDCNENFNQIDETLNLTDIIKTLVNEENSIKKKNISSLFPSKSNVLNLSNQNFSLKNTNDDYKKSESDKPITPTSQEVENLFKIGNKKQEIDLNNILPPQLEKSENFHSFKDQFVPDSLSFDTENLVMKSDLNRYLTKENSERLIEKIDTLLNRLSETKENENINSLSRKLDLLEKKLTNEMVSFRFSLSDITKKIISQLNLICDEWKNPDQFKYINKVIDSFLKKLMDELNVTISKGLEEFMSQIKTEVGEISNLLDKTKSLEGSISEANIEKYEKINKNILTVVDKLKEISDQQQNFNVEIKRNLNNFSVLPSVSPSPMIFNKSLCNSVSTLSLLEEGKVNIKMEKIANIWALIESKDDKKILDGIINALDLKEQPLTTKILKHFKEDHMKLLNIIKKDQTVLLSLLHQLTYHDFESDFWKIKFIPDILSLLDLRLNFIRKNFNLFVNKLIQKLKKIETSSNLDKSEYETTIRLTLFILDCQKKTITNPN